MLLRILLRTRLCSILSMLVWRRRMSPSSRFWESRETWTSSSPLIHPPTPTISPMDKNLDTHVSSRIPFPSQHISLICHYSTRTGDRTQQPGYEGFPFPFFPLASEFVAQGLHQKPGFFGSVCTSTTPATPLVVFLPNYEINFPTGTSTFTPTYSVADQLSFFNNGFALATQQEPNGGEWSSCLACALVDAQVARNGVARTTECDACFTKYCYLGTSDVNP